MEKSAETENGEENRATVTFFAQSEKQRKAHKKFCTLNLMFFWRSYCASHRASSHSSNFFILVYGISCFRVTLVATPLRREQTKTNTLKVGNRTETDARHCNKLTNRRKRK